MNSRPVERGWRVALRSSWGLAWSRRCRQAENSERCGSTGKEGTGGPFDLVWSIGWRYVETLRSQVKSGNTYNTLLISIPLTLSSLIITSNSPLRENE